MDGRICLTKNSNAFHWKWHIWKCKLNSGFQNFNQTLIDPDQVFNQDHDRDENFWSKVWLKNFNQGLPENFQSGSGYEKLTTCTWTSGTASRRKVALVHHFSIRVCLEIFNQGLLKKFQARSGWKNKIKVWLICEWFSSRVVIAIENFYAGSEWKSWIEMIWFVF